MRKVWYVSNSIPSIMWADLNDVIIDECGNFSLPETYNCKSNLYGSKKDAIEAGKLYWCKELCSSGAIVYDGMKLSIDSKVTFEEVSDEESLKNIGELYFKVERLLCLFKEPIDE